MSYHAEGPEPALQATLLVDALDIERMTSGIIEAGEQRKIANGARGVALQYMWAQTRFQCKSRCR